MKRKILFVNASLQVGGVEKSLCDIIKCLDPNKYDIFLYLDETGDGFYNEIEDKVIRIEPNMQGCYGRLLPVARRLLYERRYCQLLLRITRSANGKVHNLLMSILKRIYIKRYGYFDCIIAFREGEYAAFAHKVFSGDRFIGWWHGSNPPSKEDIPSYNMMKKYDRIVAVSNSTAGMIRSCFPEVKDVKTIPNMIDITAIMEKANQFMRDFPNERTFIVSVGRLAPEKHFENVIPAAKALQANGFDFVWHIIGEGPERSKLELLIKEAQLEQRVILEGSKANPYPYMKSAQLFVHPSYVESQGLTVLEAMALGVPCVVTKSRGPCEFIEDGVNGLLTEQSPESLSEKVLEILSDKELYQRIKSHTRCPEQFFPERVMKQIEELIEG